MPCGKEKEISEVPEVSWDFNTCRSGNVDTIDGMHRKTGTAICFAVPKKACNLWDTRRAMKS